MTEPVTASTLWVMGTIQVLVNGTMLAVVGVWIKANVQKINSLKKTVEQQHEARIQNVEGEQTRAKDSRGVLYNEKISKPDCDLRHEQLDRANQEFRASVIKVEKVSTRMEILGDDLDRIQAIQREQSKEIAASTERMKDLNHGK